MSGLTFQEPIRCSILLLVLFTLCFQNGFGMKLLHECKISSSNPSVELMISIICLSSQNCSPSLPMAAFDYACSDLNDLPGSDSLDQNFYFPILFCFLLDFVLEMVTLKKVYKHYFVNLAYFLHFEDFGQLMPSFFAFEWLHKG